MPLRVKNETDEDVPVIDMENLGTASSAAAWRSVGQQLTAALSHFGFAYVVNHGVPGEAIKKMFEISGKFFKLPEDQKNSIKSDGYHGYLALGRQKIGKNFELRETLDIMREDGPFPDTLVPDLKDAWQHLNALMSALSIRIFKAMEHGLELEENKLVNAHSKTPDNSMIKALMRMTNYPPIPDDCPSGAVRLEPHTDFGSMTLDIQDEHGGLEVRNRTGEWVPAECSRDGAVLVFVGDTMEKWMNGKLWAVEHRITVPKNNRLRQLPRRSLIYFCLPNDEESLAPFDGSTSETSHLTVKDYIHMKQMKTIDY